MVSDAGKLALKFVGYVFMVGEAVAPSIMTFPRIRSQHGVGQNTPFPYLFMWLSSLLQLSYAVRKLDRWDIGMHGVVFLITWIYCVIYVRYLHGNKNKKLGYVMLIFMVILLGGLILLEFKVYGAYNKDPIIKKKRDQVQGEFGFVFAVLTYISPGIEMYNAYMTHEVGGLDIVLALAFAANGIIGTVSACLPVSFGDLAVSILGTVAALVQGGIWLRCYFHNHHAAPPGPVVELV